MRAQRPTPAPLERCRLLAQVAQRRPVSEDEPRARVVGRVVGMERPRPRSDAELAAMPLPVATHDFVPRDAKDEPSEVEIEAALADWRAGLLAPADFHMRMMRAAMVIEMRRGGRRRLPTASVAPDSLSADHSISSMRSESGVSLRSVATRLARGQDGYLAPSPEAAHRLTAWLAKIKTAGAQLRGWREAHSLTAERAAGLVGTYPSTWLELERGECLPCAEVGAAIQDVTWGAVAVEAWAEPRSQAPGRPPAVLLRAADHVGKAR